MGKKGDFKLDNRKLDLKLAIDPKMYHQTPMTYGYSHFIHFKTVATEVGIQFLST